MDEPLTANRRQRCSVVLHGLVERNVLNLTRLRICPPEEVAMRTASRALLIVGFAALAIAHLSPAADQPGIPELSWMGRLAQERVAAIASGGISGGAGPSGSCVNEPDCESPAGPASTQSETSIAVDSSGQHIVIAFNDFRGFSTTTTSISGFMYS